MKNQIDGTRKEIFSYFKFEGNYGKKLQLTPIVLGSSFWAPCKRWLVTIVNQVPVSIVPVKKSSYRWEGKCIRVLYRETTVNFTKVFLRRVHFGSKRQSGHHELEPAVDSEYGAMTEFIFDPPRSKACRDQIPHHFTTQDELIQIERSNTTGLC